MNESGRLISTWISENFFWVFIAILFINILQRKHHAKAERKRFATLYLGIAAFGVYVAGMSIVEFDLTDIVLRPVVAAIGAILFFFREHTWPFRLTCRETGRRLTWDEILYDDSNLSAEAKGEEREEASEESNGESFEESTEGSGEDSEEKSKEG